MKRPRAATAATEKRIHPLPVQLRRREILSALSANDVVVLESETGSGKTTQVPQIILDSEPNAHVVITQPRRVAAMTVAAHVAAERGVALGVEVGYAVRFDDQSSGAHTRIRYVTEGVLLRETLVADALSRYTHVLVDEAHERSVGTDVLLGSLRMCVQGGGRGSRPKVVVMSATIEAEKFIRFFEAVRGLRVASVRIDGRALPVKVLYAASPVQDFVEGAVTAALQVHVDYPMDGDILAFLPGRPEISSALTLFRERAKKFAAPDSVVAFPLHASLEPSEQVRVMEPLSRDVRDNGSTAKIARKRKVVFATNVAETSVTIPSIRYVIDSGVAKVRRLIPTEDVCAEVLRLEPISRAQSEQRKGRAGRVSRGTVFRLFTEAQYEAMPPYAMPEILKVDAADTLLQIAAFDRAQSGGGVHRFPFIDHPPKAVYAQALETLLRLGALSSTMELTPVGKLMAQLPVSVKLARCLLEAARMGCVEDMVAVAAVLSVDGTILNISQDHRRQAREMHRQFQSRQGDHLMFVRILRAYQRVQGASRRAEYCKVHFLSSRLLESADAIAKQLVRLITEKGIIAWASDEKRKEAGHDSKGAVATAERMGDSVEEMACDDRLRRCIVAGFFQNTAVRNEASGAYQLLGGGGGGTEKEANRSLVSSIGIHPSSVLSQQAPRKGPPCVVFHELVVTSKAYLRIVLAVEQSWVAEYA